MYKLGKNSLARLVGVHPILAFAVMEAIKISKVDFGVAEGVRTIERQRELVKNGFSKTLNSYHLYGLAVDLVPWIDGNFRWDKPKAFKEINRAMKEVIKKYDLKGIENGFDLWGWDRPHWQLSGYREKYDVRKFIKGAEVCKNF